MGAQAPHADLRPCFRVSPPAVAHGLLLTALAAAIARDPGLACGIKEWRARASTGGDARERRRLVWLKCGAAEWLNGVWLKCGAAKGLGG